MLRKFKQTFSEGQAPYTQLRSLVGCTAADCCKLQEKQQVTCGSKLQLQLSIILVIDHSAGCTVADFMSWDISATFI